MSKIRLYGETSGYIELSAPNEANDNTVDLGLIPTVDTAPSDGQVLAWNASTGKWEPTTMSVKEKKIAAFTANGTWTVPSGVTYAIAHCLGGGGGSRVVSGGSVGGDSSVAFSGLTVTSYGGNVSHLSDNANTQLTALAGQANSGRSATLHGTRSNTAGFASSTSGIDAQYVVAGADVTPGASITVTVGSGGTAGTSGAAGGSGYVYIEYYE